MIGIRYKGNKLSSRTCTFLLSFASTNVLLIAELFLRDFKVRATKRNYSRIKQRNFFSSSSLFFVMKKDIKREKFFISEKYTKKEVHDELFVLDNGEAH